MPIPYAYILINKKPVEISDTLGIARISMSKLSNNDTISVSYLGSSPIWTIYDKSLQETKKHSFIIDESGYRLNEVVVEYQDIEKLFNKSVKKIPQINYNCNMSADFYASIKVPDQYTRNILGKFEAENEVWSKKFPYRAHGWFHHPIKLLTSSDTTKIGRQLNSHLHYILNNINRAIEFSMPNPPVIVKPQYSYLGEKDDYRVFRIVYPKTITSIFPFQILVNVDKDSKEIHSIELETISRSENDKFYNLFNIKFDCVKYNHIRPKMNTVYLPVNIQYSVLMITGSQIEIVITNQIIKI